MDANSIMKIYRLFTTLIFSSLLGGCHLFGDYIPPDETTTVTKTDNGLCFAVPNAGDYRPATIRIRPRNTPEGTGFSRLMPALSINKGALCIADSYYSFPQNGDFIVNYSLRSPTRQRERRFVVVVFKMVNGEPHLLKPSHDEAPLLHED